MTKKETNEVDAQNNEAPSTEQKVIVAETPAAEVVETTPAAEVVETPFNMVIFGPPGAGKQTQSEKVVEKYGFIHISTGELFRSEQYQNSLVPITLLSSEDQEKIKEKRSEENIIGELPESLTVAEIVYAGVYVPDSIAIKALEDERNKYPDATGFIYDGFPRTKTQAEALDNFLLEKNESIDLILQLDVSEEEIEQRIQGRKKLLGREDDDLKTFIRRKGEYFGKTIQVLSHYEPQGKVVRVNGIGEIDEIFSKICTAIDNAKVGSYEPVEVDADATDESTETKATEEAANATTVNDASPVVETINDQVKPIQTVNDVAAQPIVSKMEPTEEQKRQEQWDQEWAGMNLLQKAVYLNDRYRFLRKKEEEWELKQFSNEQVKKTQKGMDIIDAHLGNQPNTLGNLVKTVETQSNSGLKPNDESDKPKLTFADKINRYLVTLAGADYWSLRKFFPREEMLQYQTVGLAMHPDAFLAFFAMAFRAWIMGSNGWGIFGAGMVAFLIVLTIEIVLTRSLELGAFRSYKNGREFLSASPLLLMRFGIGFFLSIVIVDPVIVYSYKDGILTYQQEQIAKQVTPIKDSYRKQINDKQKEIADFNKGISDASKLLQGEITGSGGSGQKGYADRAKGLEKNIQRDSAIAVGRIAIIEKDVKSLEQERDEKISRLQKGFGSDYGSLQKGLDQLKESNSHVWWSEFNLRMLLIIISLVGMFAKGFMKPDEYQVWVKRRKKELSAQHQIASLEQDEKLATAHFKFESAEETRNKEMLKLKTTSLIEKIQLMDNVATKSGELMSRTKQFGNKDLDTAFAQGIINEINELNTLFNNGKAKKYTSLDPNADGE